MAGFVECLDNEEAEEGMEKEDGSSCLVLMYRYYLTGIVLVVKMLRKKPRVKLNNFLNLQI